MKSKLIKKWVLSFVIACMLLSSVGVVFTAKTASAASGVWQNVGSAGFSAGEAEYTSLYVDNGIPYVAYQDGGNGYKATVKKYDGSNWVDVGNAGFSADVNYTSLYVDNGIPYVAYMDGGNGYKATVKKYNGSTWVNVGSAGFSAGLANGTSLYVDNGTPYVAYRDGGNGNKATVKKYNGSTWVNVGSAGFSAGWANYTSLYVDNGTPYVTYQDGGNGNKATVKKYEGSTWVNVGSIGFSAGQANSTSLYVDNGTPYVAYQDGGNGDKATVKKYDGSNWVDVGSAGFSAGLANSTSLYVDNGTPYVAYRDGGNGDKATVKKYDGIDWVDVGSAGFSTGLANSTSLYVDNGTPYVAYRDGGIGNKATVMKLTVPANTLTATAARGTTLGTTKVTATAGASNRLATKVSSSSVTTPNIGDAVPTGTGVTDPYTAGNDLSGVDTTTNKYVSVYEVDSNDEVVSFKLITLTGGDVATSAPDLMATTSPGTTPGTTKVTATAGTGNHLVTKVSSSSIAMPNEGDAAPTGTGVTNPYTAGNDLSGIDTTTNKYVGVYEVDSNNKVVKFSLITLTVGDVAAPALTAAPSPGTTPATTKVTATAGTGNHLVTKVSSSSIATPNEGDAAPTGTGVTNPYTAGNDLSGIDTTTNKYVGVYEVDSNNKVVSFTLITLTVGDVATSAPDLTATPDAPTGVSAAAGNGQATISFTSPANGGSAITGYEVTASPGNITATGTESPITVTGLTNGTAYTFTVKAVNNAGSSAASTASNAVTPTSSNGGNGGGSAPTPTPTQSAVAGNRQVSLTWNPVDGATDYQIFKSVTSATYGAEVDTVNGSVYSYVVTGLTNGTTYYFVIKAINSEGDSLAFIELSATPKTVSAAPTGVTAAAGDGQATISFTIPSDNDNGGSAITGYEVTASSGNITVTGAKSPITVTGLSNDTAYTFTVKALNSEGSSAASTTSNSVTPRSTVNEEEEETPSSPTTSGTPAPEKEIITVDVEDSDAKAGDIVSKAVIERTTQADGTKHDEVNLTAEQAKKMVDSIIAAGSTSASIVIPDAKDEVSKLNVTVPKESREMITDANIDLGITTENVKVIIPNESLQGFTDDLYFHFIPIKDEATKQEVKERANNEAVVKLVAGDQEVSVVGRPMTIETNMQNREVTLIMPLRDVNLSEEEMNHLGIYIEHSDGTKELLKGVLVPYNNKGEMGLQFTVNKFSTFTLVQLPAAKQHTAYMNGYEDGTFRPDRSITRAEMAAILSRVIAGDAKSADKVYSDVSATHWAKDTISKVTKMGLMNGYEGGTFAPEGAITRAEMATLVALIIGDKQQAGAGFTDISGHWAQASIIKAQGAGIISGYEGSTFQPDSSLTRAEAVAIINKLLGRGPLSGAKMQWTDVPEQHWAYGQVQEASVDHAYEQKSNVGEKWVPSP